MRFPNFSRHQEPYYAALDGGDDRTIVNDKPVKTARLSSMALKLLLLVLTALGGIIIGFLACNYRHNAVAQQNWLGNLELHSQSD